MRLVERVRLIAGLGLIGGALLVLTTRPMQGQTQPGALIYGVNPSGDPRAIAITTGRAIWVGGEATEGSALAGNPVRNGLSDGTNIQTWKATSLTNFPLATTLTARSLTGAGVVEKGPRWSVVGAPASGSQASASIAAEAGVRHVADCIDFSGAATAAVTAAAGTFVVRDGATGAGTIIWAYAIAHQTAAGAGVQTIAPHALCGLNLVGTTNTAMTAELDAGITGEIQRVSISGFNVQ